MFHFSDMTSLCPTSRSSLGIILTKFKRNQPMENMGKNIKSYATTQFHSPGKGREALRQIIQIFRLQM